MTTNQQEIADIVLLIFDKVRLLFTIDFLGVPLWTYIISIAFIYIILSFFSSHGVPSVFKSSTPVHKSYSKTIINNEYGDKHWHRND